MRVRLTHGAQQDLESITSYLASLNPAAAVDLVARFKRNWSLLASHPYSAPTVDWEPRLRRSVTRKYITFYRVGNGEIVIVRILDGRPDLSAEDFSG